jgi:hypothetical protein
VILFFDRSIGNGIPKACLQIKRFPVEVHYLQQHFPIDTPDDVWLPNVGGWGWFVIGQDYNLHVRANEREAIRRYEVGVFYLWGAEAPAWDTMRCFARAFDRIVEAAANTPRPFVYRIHKNGRLVQEPLQ